MKKLFGLILLNLLFLNLAIAEEINDSLFGIKLGNKHISDEGELSDYFNKNNLFEVTNKFENLKKNKNFNDYYLVTNEFSIIKFISGMYSNSIFAKYFEDKCYSKQDDFKMTLINYYDLNKRKFNRNFYMEKFEDDYRLHRSDEFQFKYKGNKINLVLDCSYYLSPSTHDEKGTVTWRFTLSLIDNIFYNKTYKRNFRNIKEFDKSLIVSDLSGF